MASVKTGLLEDLSVVPGRAEVGHICVPCSLNSPCYADAVGRERLSLSWSTSWVSAFVPEAVPTFPTKDKPGSSKAKVPTVTQPDSDPTQALTEAPCGAFLGAMFLLPAATLQIPPVCIIPSHSICEFLIFLISPVPCQIWFKLNKKA